MTEYMTKDEYETFVRLEDTFYACLERCGIEIFLMQYKREPEGEFCFDCGLYDEDKYMVQFETYSCGESNRDTVYVPILYIHDKQYRDDYGAYLENKRREQEAAKEAEKQRVKDARAEARETNDREEYERLKKKYEVI